MENDIQKTVKQLERLKKAEFITKIVTVISFILLIITFIYD
jgi:hypothetical protein